MKKETPIIYNIAKGNYDDILNYTESIINQRISFTTEDIVNNINREKRMVETIEVIQKHACRIKEILTNKLWEEK